MKYALIFPAIGALLLTSSAGVVLGSPSGAPQTGGGPTQTGQPSQSCEVTPTTPGNAASAPGSAFNPDGKAGTVYAGEQPQNTVNIATVSQYDVACTHQPG